MFLIEIYEKGTDRAFEIQHPEPLRYLPTRLKLNQILLRFWYLLELHTTVYTMIDILQQVFRGISANNGNVNNDCHQNIF